MRIKYVGPHPAVDVPSLDLWGVERDAPVEVRKADAERLLKQDVWAAVGGGARNKNAGDGSKQEA